MSRPCECLSFLKNPLVVRYQHRSAPVVLHTSDAEAFHLCSRTLLSWSSSLRLYRCHLSFSYWIQPSSLHTSPETELCRMKQPPQIIKQTASCLLLLMQFGFRRRRMDHKLKPSTSLGTQRRRNIFLCVLLFCFVFLVAWTGWPSEFCLEALVLLYHLPCWVMITERLSVCYKLLFVDITSLLKWWHSPIQTGYLSVNVVQRLIQTNPQYVHSVACPYVEPALDPISKCLGLSAVVRVVTLCVSISKCDYTETCVMI